MYNFTRFEGSGPSKDNRISINKSSEITLPSTFCYENKIYSYMFAVLFWDNEKKAVGLHFTNKKDEKGIYKVKRSSKGGGARISAKSFIAKNKIDLSVYSGRYLWKKIDEPTIGQLFVFELNKI